MKRKPHPVHSAVSLCTGLALAALTLVGFTGTAVGEEKKEVEKKEPVRKVAAMDRQFMNAPSAPDGSVTLRSAQGQEIQAHLLSAHGDSVKIRRADDSREFIVPISTFDDYTGEQIRQWMEQDVEAVEYSLSISAQKNLVDTTLFETASREFKTSKWSYRVSVANLTRNDLAGAQLEYRVIFNDQVEFVRTAVGPGKGMNQQDGQAIDLPEMAFNDAIEFDTPAVDLNTYEYSPTRGEREFAKDSIKGIWIRITKGGKVIGEYQSSPSALASVSWDNEEDVEIRITNRFRDALGSVSEE
jgi:hypothetical protein